MSRPLAAASGGPDDDPRRRLLLETGSALLGGGLPTSDVEDELRGMGPDIGAPHARVAALPNGLFAALSGTDAARFEPVSAPLRFDQLSALLGTIARVRDGALDAPGALAEIARIRRAPARWPGIVSDLGAVPVGAGLALLLQPTPGSVLLASLASLIVAALTWAARALPMAARLLPVVSALLVSLAVIAACGAGMADGPLRIIVAVLAILLPGSAIVTGLTEIASGDQVAGSSRLVAGAVQLVMFFAGLVAAAALLGYPLDELRATPPGPAPWWVPACGIALATVGLVLFLHPPLDHIGSIVIAIGASAAVQVFVGLTVSVALGGLLGAITAALAAIVLSWLPRGATWQVTFRLAFIVVAPGSFGFLNATQVHLGDTSTAASGVYSALSAFVAIAIGTLIGAVLARASDRIVRRRPAPLPTSDGVAHQ